MFTKNHLQHIAAWSLFVAYETMMACIIAPPKDWWESFVFLIPEALFFYGHRAVLKRFPPGAIKNGNWPGILSMAVLLLISFCVVTISMRFLFSYLEHQPHPPGYMRLYIASAFFRGIYLAILSSFLWLAESIISKNKLLAREQLRLKEQEIEMMRIRQDFLIARNELYKAQIKPHILFNTLNFVHNQVAESPKAGESILLLTDIMRFSLEHDDQGGMVTMEDEWRQVINYINLQKMRFEKTMHFDSVFMNRRPCTEVPPLIILTLVENIFMHGNLFDAEKPALVHLTTEEHGWFLKTKNKKRSKGDHSTGHNMGLDNTRSRLEFYYGAENVTINVGQEEDMFCLRLKIKFVEPKPKNDDDLLYN